VNWAVRVTSLPALALVLFSLVPALMNFGVAARDDKIIALGLCAVCLGFLAGWKWPGIGGCLSLAGVGVILTQEDNAIAEDPFSLAFALQALLFLIASLLLWRPTQKAVRLVPVFKGAGIAFLALCALLGAWVICRGPGPTPLSKEQERFIGTWDNQAGFTLEIAKSGQVKVSRQKDAKIDPCNTPVEPGESKLFEVSFPSDDRLQLTSSALSQPKVYHIDRRPHPESKTIKMTLNGSDPYQRSAGVVLVRQTSTAPLIPKGDPGH
jgi:hypothetical protein